ncbi:MAG: ECF transporter S component [Candidatus Lokiarchaeota archaeon]|nr:ECF transporter S component [Candidatus Lokiarchaeota archaeon]
MLQNYPPSLSLAITAIMTALVCITTLVFQISIPQTQGFFNLGDSAVYISAILFGPIIGAFSGGVGSALADLILGYGVFAPITLVTKGAEGFVVGLISNSLIPPKKTNTRWTVFISLTGLVVGVIIILVGLLFYSTPWQIGIGFLASYQFFEINPIPIVWVVLGCVSAALIVVGGLRTSPEVAWLTFSILIGGSCMVIGYFVAEYWLLGFGTAAFVEIPFNIGQMTIGGIIAIPVSQSLKRALPFLIASQE